MCTRQLHNTQDCRCLDMALFFERCYSFCEKLCCSISRNIFSGFVVGHAFVIVPEGISVTIWVYL